MGKALVLVLTLKRKKGRKEGRKGKKGKKEGRKKRLYVKI
jgi:hypothetical protein